MIEVFFSINLIESLISLIEIIGVVTWKKSILSKFKNLSFFKKSKTTSFILELSLDRDFGLL